MAWVRIDDGFYQHPKVLAAGPLGMALYVAGICYCNRYLTDGHLPRVAVPTLVNFDGTGQTWEQVVERLVAVGLWAEAHDGYQVHDYLEYQPSRDKVLKDREAARDRMRRQRKSSPGGSSDEVQANNNRSSEEVREKFTFPNPTPKDIKSSPNGDGQARRRAASRPAYTSEHKRPVEHLKRKLQERGVRSLPRDWHLKGYAVSKQMQAEDATADDLIACIEWMAQDDYWSRNMDSMSAVRGAWAQFRLASQPVRASPTEPEPGYYDPMPVLEHWEEGEP